MLALRSGRCCCSWRSNGMSAQTRRVEALPGQVEGLEVQLSAANVQLRNRHAARAGAQVGAVLQQMSSSRSS